MGFLSHLIGGRAEEAVQAVSGPCKLCQLQASFSLRGSGPLIHLPTTYSFLCWCLAAAFLHRMRDYMPPSHRAFVEEIQQAVSLKQHVLSSGNVRLRAAFNRCVSALTDFRSYHIIIVTKYITIAAAKAKAGRAEPSARAGPSGGKPPSALEAKGTGGSHIFSFLKSIRDTTREGMISA